MADANFPSVTPPTITGVRDISYTIFDPDPDGEEIQSMRYEAQLIWSDGNTTTKAGDVVPHLTNAELTGLQALMLRLRGKAETAWGDAP